jgi:PEP-CTERM motif
VDALRIMPKACDGSRMSRLITLVILSLAAPSLASAQIGEEFTATSGGTNVISEGFVSAEFTVAGPGFSMSGSISTSLLDNFNSGPPIVGNINELALFGDIGLGGGPHNLSFSSVDVHGAPAAIVLATVNFDSIFLVPGPGTHLEPFEFHSLVCDTEQIMNLDCFGFDGKGNVTLDVVATSTPGIVRILDATYNFTNPFAGVPEPSTASLALIGFAGLAVLGRRRRSHALLLASR